MLVSFHKGISLKHLAQRIFSLKQQPINLQKNRHFCQKLFSILGIVALAFFLTGCAKGALQDFFANRPVSKEGKTRQTKIQAQSTPKNTSKKLLYINSKMFRYYDYATFGVNDKQEIVIELFGAGILKQLSAKSAFWGIACPKSLLQNDFLAR